MQSQDEKRGSTFAHERIHFGFLTTRPRNILELGSIVHVDHTDTIKLIVIRNVGSCFLVSIIAFICLTSRSSCRLASSIIPCTNYIIMLLSCIVIIYATLLLYFRHCLSGINSIVVSEVVETNILSCVWNASFLNSVHDAVTTSANAIVLVCHDSTSA